MRVRVPETTRPQKYPALDGFLWRQRSAFACRGQDDFRQTDPLITDSSVSTSASRHRRGEHAVRGAQVSGRSFPGQLEGTLAGLVSQLVSSCVIECQLTNEVRESIPVPARSVEDGVLAGSDCLA